MVEPGERIGIVGATGSGKTTLLSLLLRFYDVNRGRDAVDGIDVRDWTWRRSAGCLDSCCRTSTCFLGRSPTTSGSVTPG